MPAHNHHQHDPTSRHGYANARATYAKAESSKSSISAEKERQAEEHVKMQNARPTLAAPPLLTLTPQRLVASNPVAGPSSYGDLLLPLPLTRIGRRPLPKSRCFPSFFGNEEDKSIDEEAAAVGNEADEGSDDIDDDGHCLCRAASNFLHRAQSVAAPRKYNKKHTNKHRSAMAIMITRTKFPQFCAVAVEKRTRYRIWKQITENAIFGEGVSTNDEFRLYK